MIKHHLKAYNEELPWSNSRMKQITTPAFYIVMGNFLLMWVADSRTLLHSCVWLKYPGSEASKLCAKCATTKDV